MGTPVFEEQLEACPPAVAVRIPPALVGGPRAGPTDDLCESTIGEPTDPPRLVTAMATAGDTNRIA
jgi:hypothetical protein